MKPILFILGAVFALVHSPLTYIAYMAVAVLVFFQIAKRRKVPPGCGINTTSQTAELVPGVTVTQMVVDSATPWKCSLMTIAVHGNEMLSISKPLAGGFSTILVCGKVPKCKECDSDFYLDLSGGDLKPLRDYLNVN